jgi:hypothetical protein
MRNALKVALVVLLVTVGCGGPFEDGAAAYYRGDYTTALRLIRPLAEQGDAAAQFWLGLMYDRGKGVPQDFAKAIKWYRLAADQGDAPAQRHLGAMYEHGKGVPQDYAEARKWVRQAAEQGYARAHYNLGVMHRDGLGVPRDYVLAHMWFNLATSHQPSKALRDRAVLDHSAVAAKMTTAQIAEAQQLAREWTEQHQ